MNERGFTLIELVVSFTIVFGILFSTLTVYQQLNAQSSKVLEDWSVFWKVKGAVRQWQQNDTGLIEEGEPLQIQWNEKLISSTILEGEFRIRWTSKNMIRERVFYAYKKVEPLPNY